jgi:hypothetical protein
VAYKKGETYLQAGYFSNIGFTLPTLPTLPTGNKTFRYTVVVPQVFNRALPKYYRDNK